MLSDMELSAHQFFRQNMHVHEAILKTASIYGFLGYATAANDLRLVAGEISGTSSAICGGDATPLLLAM